MRLGPWRWPRWPPSCGVAGGAAAPRAPPRPGRGVVAAQPARPRPLSRSGPVPTVWSFVPLRAARAGLDRPGGPELVQSPGGLASHRAPRDPQHRGDLLVGALLVVAQHQDGPLARRKGRQRAPQPGVAVDPVQLDLAVAALRNLVDEVLAAYPPPPADMDARHRGAHVRLRIAPGDDPPPPGSDPDQSLLDHVRRVMAV